LERMGKMVSSIKEGAEISDEMMEEFTKYETEMKPHLQEEEDVALPLTRAYFTPKELAPKIQEIIGHGPKVGFVLKILSATTTHSSWMCVKCSVEP
jgi:iron-sulfur cluster repair protein YtfE (RIC family)